MKMDREQARAAIFKAMVQANGNRSKAAKFLDVSIRTFYRYLDEYEMHPMFDRMGWTTNPGPPRGARGQGLVVRGLILRHIRDRAGNVDFGGLAKDVYGQDNPPLRQRLFGAMEEMQREGQIELTTDGVWRVA